MFEASKGLCFETSCLLVTEAIEEMKITIQN